MKDISLLCICLKYNLPCAGGRRDVRRARGAGGQYYPLGEGGWDEESNSLLGVCREQFVLQQLAIYDHPERLNLRNELT